MSKCWDKQDEIKWSDLPAWIKVLFVAAAIYWVVYVPYQVAVDYGYMMTRP